MGIHQKGWFSNLCEILFSLKNLLKKTQGTKLHNTKLTDYAGNRDILQHTSLDPECIKRSQQKEGKSMKTGYPAAHSQWYWLASVPWLASKWGCEDEVKILADVSRPRESSLPTWEKIPQVTAACALFSVHGRKGASSEPGHILPQHLDHATDICKVELLCLIFDQK